MPQVHNKSVLAQDTGGFSKHSRYNASLRFTDASLKKVKVLNALEQRMTRVKMNYFERHEGIMNNKFERMKNRLLENSNKRLAYKLVLKHHNIEKAKDYKKALDGNYSYDYLYHEVKDMLVFMKPDAIQQRRAKALVQENRKRYFQVLQKNKDNMDRIFPPPKKWEPVDFSKIGKKEEEEEEKEEEKKPLTKIDLRNKLALATLRRRVIALDSKPNSPIKSPTRPPKSPIKTPSISKPPTASSSQGGKRQGITMEMMKKQKSFIEVQGKLDTIELPKTVETNNASEGQTIGLDKDELKLRLHGAVGEEDNDVIRSDGDTDIVTLSDTGRNRKSKRSSVSTQGSFNSNRVSVLPPIQKTNGVSKPPKMKTGSDKPVKLPALKMRKEESKPVEVTT